MQMRDGLRDPGLCEKLEIKMLHAEDGHSRQVWKVGKVDTRSRPDICRGELGGRAGVGRFNTGAEV